MTKKLKEELDFTKEYIKKSTKELKEHNDFLDRVIEGVKKLKSDNEIMRKALTEYLCKSKKRKKAHRYYVSDEINDTKPHLITGTMSAGKSNMFPTLFWGYHCTCGAHYQGIFEQFKYQANKNVLPIQNCPQCGKVVYKVSWLDYGNTEREDK